MHALAVMRKVAHDPGDPQITSHCAFCGSGQIVGRSDGNIECEFCGMVYLVRVQPMFTGMPGNPMGAPFGADSSAAPDMMAPEMLGPDGAPMMSEDVPPEMLDPSMMGPDGMPLEAGLPGEDEGEPGEGDEAEEDGGGPPWADGDGGDDADSGDSGDDEESEEKQDSGPPPKKTKKKSSRQVTAGYRTIAGDVLPEEAYIRHLAVLHGGIEVVRRQAHIFNGLPWDDPQHLVDKHGWGALDAQQMTPEERKHVHDADHPNPLAGLPPPVGCRFCSDTFMTPYLATLHERAAHPAESGETGFNQSDKDWLGGQGIEASRRTRRAS